MAIRLKTKWHKTKRVSTKGKRNRARPRTMEDRAGVVAFNIWKIALQTFKNMEQENFRFATDDQAMDTLTEVIAFLVQITDRTVYGKVSEEDRTKLVNAIAMHLARTMENNQDDFAGSGDHRERFVNTLNQRFADYADCEYNDDGPGYAFKRYLGQKVSEILAETDNKWVIEHVMEIEIPQAIKPLKQLIHSALGI